MAKKRSKTVPLSEDTKLTEQMAKLVEERAKGRKTKELQSMKGKYPTSDKLIRGADGTMHLGKFEDWARRITERQRKGLPIEEEKQHYVLRRGKIITLPGPDPDLPRIKTIVYNVDRPIEGAFPPRKEKGRRKPVSQTKAGKAKRYIEWLKRQGEWLRGLGYRGESEQPPLQYEGEKKAEGDKETA